MSMGASDDPSGARLQLDAILFVGSYLPSTRHIETLRRSPSVSKAEPENAPSLSGDAVRLTRQNGSGLLPSTAPAKFPPMRHGVKKGDAPHPSVGTRAAQTQCAGSAGQQRRLQA